MRNYNGNPNRPAYFCLKDKRTGLFWVVPMSTRIEKYQNRIDNDLSKYGKNKKIIIGTFAGKQSVFLFQNMFPLLPKYFDHVYTIKGNPVPINQNLRSILDRNFRDVMDLHKKGEKVVFTDIDRLVKQMVKEASSDKRINDDKTIQKDKEIKFEPKMPESIKRQLGMKHPKF